MIKNPYIYTGPLGPDKPVNIPRDEELTSVRKGISEGDYWAVLGPRQIGKTTFLRQLAIDLLEQYCIIHISLQNSPRIEKNFYNWLQKKFLKENSLELDETREKWKNEDEPHVKFLNFLENLEIKDKNSEKRKIVLLFDEIERAPYLGNFLHLWRTVYEERDNTDELKKYAVIVAGSSTLFKFTTKPGSPYNISKPLFLNELSETGVEKLIEVAFNGEKISIDNRAKKELLEQTSGHPQLLQHSLHILVNKAIESDMNISKEHVDYAISLLLKENLSLITLKDDIRNDVVLKNLLKDILNGEKKEFHPYQDYSISGAGAIIEKNSSCEIRNEVFRRCIRDVLKSTVIEPPSKKTKLSIRELLTYLAIVITIITGFLSVLTNSSIGLTSTGILIVIALALSVGLAIQTKIRDKKDEKD